MLGAYNCVSPLLTAMWCRLSARLHCGRPQALTGARAFPAKHGDFVHDVAYDYYGKRLATCSSDEKIKV